MPAVQSEEMPLIIKIKEGIEVPVSRNYYVRTLARVSAVRYAPAGIFIAIKRTAPLSSITGLNINLDLIYKHFNVILGLEFYLFYLYAA